MQPVQLDRQRSSGSRHDLRTVASLAKVMKAHEAVHVLGGPLPCHSIDSGSLLVAHLGEVLTTDGARYGGEKRRYHPVDAAEARQNGKQDGKI